jgi:hypothetical protein
MVKFRVGPGWLRWADAGRSTWWAHLVGPAVGAVIAVGVAYVLRGPAKTAAASAAQGTPLHRTTG